MIPDGWGIFRLDQLGGKDRPAVKAGPFGSSLKKEFYVSKGYKIYGQEQVISGDPYCGNYYIDEARYASLKSCAIVPGDVLISLVGTVGRVLVIPEGAELGIINPRLLRLSLSLNRIAPQFIRYFLESTTTRNKLESWSQGGTMGVLNANIFKTLPIPVPPLPEQKKIAQILSTWDKAIETVEKLIANSQQKKKALMQQLLTGKKRFPEFDGEWKEVQLGDISRITTGSSNREDSSVCDGEFAFFDRSEDIRTSSRYLFDNEAVIIPGEGQKFVPKHFKGKFDLHQRTYAIMDFKNTLGKFLYYYIGYFQHYFLAQAVGSTVKSLRLPMFQKMPIKLPCIEEQQKITSILSSADQDIETWQQELEHLKQEKKALMQQLLTGKRRVTVDTAKTGDTHA